MEKGRFGQVRLEAMQQAWADGKTSNEELQLVAKKAENKAIELIGEQSERRFVKFASESSIVKSVINANPLDDVHEAIDKWIVFIDGFNLPPLPVQIKSSFPGVEKFKNGDANRNIKPNRSFTKLHGLMVVVNCGPSSSKILLDRQLMKETGRIVQILKNDPKGRKLLTNITPNRLKDNQV